MNRDRFMARLEGLGHWFFYVTLRFFGHRGGIVLLAPVMSCYVIFSRKIHAVVKHYLRLRFPGEPWWSYPFHTFRNLFSFGQVLVERGWLGLRRDAELTCDFVGKEELFQLIEKGRGVVLLTAHVGNWQSALSHLGDLPVKVHALMRYDQQAAAKHFFDLRPEGPPFAIIDAEGPFGGMVDAVAALQRGEVVTIMGDRYVKGSASTVSFFGEPVRVPDGAYMLAASAQSPVVVLLAAKTGLQSYQLKVWDVYYPAYSSRDERPRMLRDCAGRFIASVEEYLKVYPYQWYNFYNFWKQ